MTPDDLPAYARALGIVIAEQAPGAAPRLSAPFGGTVEGRPGVWHGGATGGLLETAGYAALDAALAAAGRRAALKPINVTVQYLAAGQPAPLYAQGRVTRMGRRTANVTVEAWQDDRDRPVASAVMNVLLGEA